MPRAASEKDAGDQLTFNQRAMSHAGDKALLLRAFHTSCLMTFFLRAVSLLAAPTKYTKNVSWRSGQIRFVFACVLRLQHKKVRSQVFLKCFLVYFVRHRQKQLEHGLQDPVVGKIPHYYSNSTTLLLNCCEGCCFLSASFWELDFLRLYQVFAPPQPGEPVRICSLSLGESEDLEEERGRGQGGGDTNRSGRSLAQGWMRGLGFMA